MRRFVEDMGIGLAIDQTDPAAIAEGLRTLCATGRPTSRPRRPSATSPRATAGRCRSSGSSRSTRASLLRILPCARGHRDRSVRLRARERLCRRAVRDRCGNEDLALRPHPAGSRIGAMLVLGQNVMVGPDVSVGDGCKVQNNVSIYKRCDAGGRRVLRPVLRFHQRLTIRAPKSSARTSSADPGRRGATIGANATIVCGNDSGEYALSRPARWSRKCAGLRADGRACRRGASAG